MTADLVNLSSDDHISECNIWGEGGIKYSFQLEMISTIQVCSNSVLCRERRSQLHGEAEGGGGSQQSQGRLHSSLDWRQTWPHLDQISSSEEGEVWSSAPGRWSPWDRSRVSRPPPTWRRWSGTRSWPSSPRGGPTSACRATTTGGMSVREE